MTNQLKVPDIGDFEQVEIVEVIVKVGEKIKKNDPVVTLESDKSSVEVPSEIEGVVSNINVKVGNKQILSNINLNINFGENLLILGPNGSGKSTFLKLLNRSIYPIVSKNSSLKLFNKENITLVIDCFTPLETIILFGW